MRTLRQIRRESIFAILDVLKFVLILILLLMFIRFNATAVKQAENTQKIAESTNTIVKSQGDILTAIKQVTEDTRITAAEQTSIIICMLQVPIADRSTDLQAQCRKQATDALSSGNEEEITGTGSVDASSNTTPDAAQMQSINSQNSSNEPPTSEPEPEAPAPNFLERTERAVERTLAPVLAPINNLLNR